jgi:hypothetical protein
MTSSPAASPCSRLHLLVYSNNRGLHRHSLPLCASQPSWRPSLLVSSPTWREVVSTGPLFCTPDTGNTGACLRPRCVPESGKLGRSASSPCLSLRTLFWHNRSMPSSPTWPGFSKAMATPRPRRLRLHRLRHRSSRRLPRCVTVLLWRTTRLRLQVRLH